MNLDIYNVAKITKSKIVNPDYYVKKSFRRFTILTDKGEEFEINCFADDLSKLKIKDEE